MLNYSWMSSVATHTNFIHEHVQVSLHKHYMTTSADPFHLTVCIVGPLGGTSTGSCFRHIKFSATVTKDTKWLSLSQHLLKQTSQSRSGWSLILAATLFDQWNCTRLLFADWLRYWMLYLYVVWNYHKKNSYHNKCNGHSILAHVHRQFDQLASIV